MLEGSAIHCEYIHSPSIVQFLHFSNALGLIDIKQVLCQSCVLLKKSKKSIKYQPLRDDPVCRDRGRICQVIVCAWAQSLWARGLSRWFKTAGRLSPKADCSVICRHAFTTHIFAWLTRNYDSVVRKIRFDHRAFNKISKMEPLQKFFRVLFLKNFENIQMRKTSVAANAVRITSLYFAYCRSFETLHCRKSLSYTDSSELQAESVWN